MAKKPSDPPSKARQKSAALERAPEIVKGEVIEEATKKVTERVAEILIKAESYRGPLPHPEILAKYDKAVPGLANRIVQMAEREQAHRHGLDNETVAVENRLSQRGLIYGLVVAITGLVAATVLGVQGNTVAASVVGGGDLLGLVAVFVLGRRTGPASERNAGTASNGNGSGFIQTEGGAASSSKREGQT